MPVTNLAPILAPAPEAPNPFGRDRETGADGFALLLAFLAGAPAASGEAPATSSSPAGGADSSVASRAVGPGLVSAGAASAFAAEIVSGGDTVADRGLGVPARESAASGGPALPAAAGAPFEAVSAVAIARFASPAIERLSAGSSAAPPYYSPGSNAPSTGVPLSLSVATASLPDLPATGSDARIAEPETAPIRNLGPIDLSLTGIGDRASAIERTVGADQAVGPVPPSDAPMAEWLRASVSGGSLARPAGPLFDMDGRLARPAAASSAPTFVASTAVPAIGARLEVGSIVSPSETVSGRSASAVSANSFEPGPAIAPAIEALSTTSSGAASGVLRPGAPGTNGSAVRLAVPSLADPAVPTAPGRPDQRPSQPLTADPFVTTVGTEPSLPPGDPLASRLVPSSPLRGAVRGSGEAEANGLSPRAAAAAPAGGGDPEARVPQPVAAADPAGSPGERMAAAGSVKVAVSGARTSGGSAEAGVGDGSKSPADPGSPLDRAGAYSAPVLDAPPLSEPAAAGRSAEPLVPPRVPSVPVPQPPAVQVAATLLQRDGVPIERLRIALEPAELGSVELTLTSEGRRKVRAVVLVERPETLELLQRDQGTLERILVASGLELEAGGLEFGLRRDDQGRPEPFVPSPHASGPGGPGRSAAAPTPPRSLDLRLLDLVV